MVKEVGPEKASWLEQAGLQGLESMTRLDGGWDNATPLRLIDGYEGPEGLDR